MAGPLLEVRDLEVAFDLPGQLFRPARRLRAVDGISLDVRSGETLGIVGESGCGKSTLGRTILRLIEPTGGTVRWQGRDLAGLDPRAMREVRRDLQIIFQDPVAALDPRMTVEQIIAEPLVTFRPELGRAAIRDQVRAMMQRVGLAPQHVNRYPHAFSGGQCQRIAIARAVILKPQLLVCDEPVSALDVSIQAQILNLLVGLQDELGLSMVFISHNLSVVKHISHRIAVLYLGRVVEVAETAELFRAPRHPYTQALISAIPLPDPDQEQARRRIVLEGDLPSPMAPPSGCSFRTRCPHAIAACAATRPALEIDGDGHTVACLRWRDLG